MKLKIHHFIDFKCIIYLNLNVKGSMHNLLLLIIGAI
jgi:hypothetical protein